MSHYCSLKWFHIFPGVLLSLTLVNFCHFKCTIANQSLRYLCWPICSIISYLGGSLSLLICSTTHWHCSLSSQVFHSCSTKLLCVISGVPLSLAEMFLCHPWYSTVASGCGFASSLVSYNDQWCRFALFQLSYCWSLEWLCLVPSVPLLLTGVALHHLRCSIVVQFGKFLLSQVFYSCSLVLLHIIQGVQLG